MASVQHPEANRWVVHMASQSEPDDEVTIELHMSKADADKLASLEKAHMAAPNSDRDCPATDDVGSAVLGILSSLAAIARVKEHTSTSDQQELMDLIDEEVDAVRAGRP